jgi:hypothetical protein
MTNLMHSFLMYKYFKKECIKLVIIQNCIKMHGQQNIKFYGFLHLAICNDIK